MSSTGRDTIYALATAPGRAAIAVVRVSGPRAGEALDWLAGGRPQPRVARLCTLRSSAGERLDDALVLWFPGPGSYTGEDAVEFHLHGGRAVVEGVLEALGSLGFARLADPGEFTRRAFENGRLDLTQAEAVADLIDAETSAQRAQALAQLDGELGRRYEAWRLELVEALALLEAAIDFPDEDLPEDLADRVRPRIERLVSALDDALADAPRGERIRDGWRVAIVGSPNAGKSSLFNAVVGREAAIVTEQPGTTRDVIEAVLDLNGFRVLLADTAGVRETHDVVEAEGVRRARRWADQADLRLWVVDASASDGSWREASDLVREGDLLLLNKEDVRRGTDAQEALAHAQARMVDGWAMSTFDTASVDRLVRELGLLASKALQGADLPAVTRERHRQRLAEARDHLQRGLAVIAQPELAAEDIRLAARSLGRVAGRVDTEDVLDVVFSRFCIGK